MNKKTLSLGLIGFAAAGLFAGQAFATTCPVAVPTGNATHGGPVCIAQAGLDATNLQDTMDSITSHPGDIDVYNDQVSHSALWSVGGSALSENRFVFELTADSDVNTFGIFDPTASDPTSASSHLELFDGSAGTGTYTQLAVSTADPHDYIATYFNAAGLVQGQGTATFGVANMFGYYIGTPGGFYYSVPSMNGSSGAYPNGNPYMVAYAGDNSTSLTIGSFSGLFQSGEYLLAWEDAAWNKSDLDYNDMVVEVESVHPVPEPAALGVFGFGILLMGGFVALRRRRAHQV